MSQRTSRSVTFRHGIISCAMFGITFGLLVITSLIDLYLGALSLTAQRWLGLLTVVVPPAIGVGIGIIGLRQPGRDRLLALVGVILNTLVTLFFVAVLVFAG
jgi:hypothetical protein